MPTIFKFAAPLAFVSALLANEDTRVEFETFLENNCYECHDDLDTEADLDLMNLEFDPTSKENKATWERVFRKVHSGDMPPGKRRKPDKTELEDFLGKLREPLLESDLADILENGRVRSRRLTREEYQYSLQDILAIDIPLIDLLTADAEEGFTTTAASQQLSSFHLSSYMDAADLALEEAFSRAIGDDHAFKQWFGRKALTQGIERANYRGPQRTKTGIVSWPIGIQFGGRMMATKVPEAGWYDVTVHNVRGINCGEDGAVWAVLNSTSGNSDDPIQHRVGLVEATPEARDLTFRAWIKKDYGMLLIPAEGDQKRLSTFNRKPGYESYSGRDLAKEGFNGVAFTGISVNRVQQNGTRDEVLSKIAPGLSVQELVDGPETPEKHLERLIGDFARRTFRQPTSPDVLEPYVKISLGAYEEGNTFSDSLRRGYQAILCSPYFLTFVEEPGMLDDHAIAARLSYLLWKSVPDGELSSLADEGRLSDPAVLSSQVDRMLADEKSGRFIASFTDQWLELRDINATQPDPRRFRIFDPVLQDSMVEETRLFFRELVMRDLSVENFLESDFTFANTRLARHYGIAFEKLKSGQGIQKIALDKDSRSGLLTQGAIMKVTADGSVSSPVLRGVFVNERILGHHIDPPPPNTPAIEPDTRGAVSIRDQLEKHKSSSSCASCHVKIDPAGFALEEFDPVGQLRDFYGRVNESAKVDSSGITPDGEEFSNYHEWKEIQLSKPEHLARAFASQITTYATGADIRFSDDEILNKITAQSRKNNYGIRTIIKEMITSPLFLRK
ncbi:DUF1592 domain-containing protein [Luteolibacter algae]|uniref:DUF1592 domain-containing protein n=1 Tax=Luteolibacter algae TaxID=454151 RepID=A0ABW5D727_9BACT